MRDPYLYSDSEVPKNLADIQDEQTLKDMEADYTLYRLVEFQNMIYEKMYFRTVKIRKSMKLKR